MNSPQQLRRHSPNEQSNVKASNGTKSVTNERVTEDDLVEKKGPAQEDVWARLMGRDNKERIFIIGHPVTALLDTGSQVIHVSHGFCLANGFKFIQSLN